jgi:hypothetical protein
LAGAGRAGRVAAFAGAFFAGAARFADAFGREVEVFANFFAVAFFAIGCFAVAFFPAAFFAGAFAAADLADPAFCAATRVAPDVDFLAGVAGRAAGAFLAVDCCPAVPLAAAGATGAGGVAGGAAGVGAPRSRRGPTRRRSRPPRVDCSRAICVDLPNLDQPPM